MAGVQKIFNHKDMMIAELQAEAWPPNGKQIINTSLAEQNKSLDANRLKGRFEYGKATGMRSIDLWGAEYWYYRTQVLHDPVALERRPAGIQRQAVASRPKLGHTYCHGKKEASITKEHQ